MSQTQTFFPVRVNLARKESGQQSVQIFEKAHEVFLIDSSLNTRNSLKDHIEQKFKHLDKSSSGSRANVHGSERGLWPHGGKVDHLKAVWDTKELTNSPWTQDFSSPNVNETEITDHNVEAVLDLLQRSPPATVALNVLVASPDESS